MATSPLKHLLANFEKPFAFPNGVPIKTRLKSLLKKCGGVINHIKAKADIQKKYFSYEKIDDQVKIFSFVGRITEQKGVLMILQVAEHILKTRKDIQFLIGGPIA